MSEWKQEYRTLLEMLVGILLWGIFWQLAGVWFVEDKLWCSAGLWCGVLLAMASAVHMCWALSRALDRGEGGAQKMIIIHGMVRYLVIVVCLGGMMMAEKPNPLTAFLGLMGLKAAAYLQPFIHKVIHKML